MVGMGRQVRVYDTTTCRLYAPALFSNMSLDFAPVEMDGSGQYLVLGNEVALVYRYTPAVGAYKLLWTIANASEGWVLQRASFSVSLPQKIPGPYDHV